MEVIALEIGFDNVTLRHPGEKFEVPEGVVMQAGAAWFEPTDPKAKAKVEDLRAAAKAAQPSVAAIDPGKQAAEHEASLKALTEKHETTLKALRDEIDALKKAQKPK